MPRSRSSTPRSLELLPANHGHDLLGLSKKIERACISHADAWRCRYYSIMPPPDDGNEPLPFVDLMRLKRIDDVTYQSIALPFSPGGITPGALRRSFGGHVYAQAAWAACQTVERGLLLYVCKSESSFDSTLNFLCHTSLEDDI